MMGFKMKMELERMKHDLERQKHEHEKARDAGSLQGTGGAELLQQMHRHLTAPVEVVRGPDGRATGLRRVLPN